MKTAKSILVLAISACVYAGAGGMAQAAAPITGTIDAGNGFLVTSAPIKHSRFNDGTGTLNIAPGTMAYSTSITVGGKSRRYVVLRPTASAGSAPVLLLLHPSFTSAEVTANITNVADYVLTQGFWAVMPEAIGGSWDADPARKTDTDVPFISALIDTLVAQGGVDATRIYAAGFSSGAFMTERLACELSDKIAGFGIDAATLRNSLAAACSPAKARSKIYFLGTTDPIVAYNGVFPNGKNGMKSAEGTLAFWNAQQHCTGVVSSTLPDRVEDATTEQLDQYTGCTAGTSLDFYTINGGGHEWPGGTSTLLGKTTQDIAATGLIWNFVSPLRR